jgi:squalene-hopene/tetraprenyl-beta-curcumene cyclase/sporulenol synthase
LIAFEKAGRRDTIFERGVGYLRGQMRDDGGVPFVPDLDIWVTALAGLGVAGVPGRPFDLDPLARYLVGAELPAGGWCFTTGIDAPDVDDTGACVMFLERWDAARYAAQVDRGRRFVVGFRNDDGGFPAASMRGAGSEAEITARSVLVMAGERERYGAEIGAALRWLEQAQREDGTFALEWTLCANYPIAYVLLALGRVGGLASAPGMSNRCLAYLLRHQHSDGGWGPVPESPAECLPTAYALIALAQAPAPPLAAIRLACDFLLGRQRADGGFSSPPDAVGPRPLVYEMDLYPTIYALWGLTAASALAAHQRNVEVAAAVTSRE